MSEDTFLSRSISDWSAEEVQKWLAEKYPEHVASFEDLSGEDFESLTNDDFVRRCPKLGDVICNAVQTLKTQRKFPLFQEDPKNYLENQLIIL